MLNSAKVMMATAYEPLTDAPLASPPTRQSSRNNLSLWIILLLTVLVYLPTLRFDFIYDDILISPNDVRLQHWSSLPKFFVQSLWQNVEAQANAPDKRYYRPLANSWVLINLKLFGLRAWAFHLSSILVHLFSVTLAFLVVSKLTQYDQFIPAAATLMFALHPVHAEPVSWISAFGDLWMTACVLASLFYFLKAREELAKGKWLVYSIIWFAAALCFKETAIVLPGIIVVYLWMGERRVSRSWWRVLYGYVAVAVAYLGLRQQVLQGISHPSDLPWSTEILTWPSLSWFYVKHLFFPSSVSMFYYLDYVDSFTPEGVLLPLVGVGAIVWALYRLAKPGREVVAGVGLMLLVLPTLPALHLRLFIWRDLAHDRYLYLPSAGFCILIALLLSRLPRIGEKTIFGQPVVRVLALIFIGCVSIFGLSLDIRPFTNNYTLYARAVEVNPDNAPMVWGWASQLESRGRTLEALALFRRAAKLAPYAHEPLRSLADIELRQKDYSQAREHLLRLTLLQPADPHAHFLLGLAFTGERNYLSAEQSFRKAAQLAPNQAGFHELIARSLEAQGKKQEARREYEEELRVDPGNPVARKFLNR